MTSQIKVFSSVLFFILCFSNVSAQQCENSISNEHPLINLPSGTLVGGVDNVIGTNTDTNGSPCALVVGNVDVGQPWGRYRISINLIDNDITAGDEIFISIDGKSLTGIARFEANRNNTPNAALARHTFGNEWSRYESTFVVPEGLSTIDLWFFSNYTQQTAGNAVYDNLMVRKVNEEVLDFSNAFVTTWKTDNPGVSANNQITIPTSSVGSYDYSVDWGDGIIESGFTGDATHTYSNAGTYTVSIIGDFPNIYFNGVGDKDKILTVVKWGNIVWGSSFDSIFNGCTNLDVIATDIPNTANVFSYTAMFQDCKSLIGNYSFNNWDVGNSLGMAYMFAGAELFNQDISNWILGTTMNMDGMFEGATSFNQPLNFQGMERTPTMVNMLKGATSFDQDLSLMPRHGSDMTGMLVNSGMSNENYDKTLIGWATKSIDPNVVLDAPDNQYCISEEARHTLINEYGWTINDGGKNCETTCPNDLPNEDASIVLLSGTTVGGVDSTIGTSADTNFSDCALVVSNNDSGQPWGRYRISINLIDNDITAGDEIFISIDGKSLTGIARFEANRNNTPNAALARHTFGNEWSRYESTFVVPEGLSTIDLWFFSNYTQQTAGNAVYDNLVVRKVNDEVLDFSNAFVTTWKTDNPGVSANNQITIPTFPGEVIGINGSTDYSYNYDVDWGDGNIDLGVSGDATHTYDVPGTYTVSIIGEFPQIYFNASGDKDKILSVAQWGNIQLVNMTSAFEGCSNLDVVALDIPSRAIDYKAMFKDCKSLVGNSKFNDWDMHDAFGVAYMFAGAELFNQDISNWSFGTLFNMNGMFEGATSFNQPVSWAYSERTPTMINMFKDATSFDQDLSLMPRHGSDMTGMLVNSGMSNENYDKTLIGWGSRPKESDVVFDAPDNQYCLSEEARQTLIDDYGWTINDAGKSCLADFSNAFVTTWKTDNPGVSGNNQITIPTSSVGSYDYSVDWGDGIIESGFTGDATHTYSNAGTYTVSIIGDFPGIHFNDTGDKEKLRQVIKWGDNTWSRFDGAFKGCTNLDVVATDIPDLSNVSSFTEMFSGCSNLIGNNSFNSWNVSSATTMLGMFHGATKFNQPLGNWNVSNVLETIGMFMESGFNQDVSSWNVSKVERMNSMFRGAIVFNQSLGEWSLNSITNMDGMLDDTDLSIENYDATLIGWKNGAPINGITLGAINLTYCTSEQARQELIAINGWTINDAGKSCSTIACTNDLANEDSFMVLPSGTLVGGVDSAIGTNSDTNGSPCALVVENVDANQPWGRYKISLNLSAQGISAGDELYISVDGKSLSGQARFEINRNDTPNATLARNTFGSDWSKFESTFVIPSGLTTIDLWFFSNYTQQTAGKAIYDNLTVINMSTAATARSIQETKPLNDLTIYPNPANIETTLSFKQPTTVGTIQVFDVTGRLVQTIKGGSIDQKGTPVNVQEMPQGVYFVKTIDVSGVEFQQQMLIQRQ